MFPGGFDHVFGRDLQKTFNLTRKMRVKIPGLYCVNAMHGDCVIRGATVFPTQRAISCSWNLPLAKQMAVVTAVEMQNTGHSTVLGPVLDIARDPRWGRLDASFGEDPFLIGEFAAAMVQGYKEKNVLTCLKHYAGYIHCMYYYQRALDGLRHILDLVISFEDIAALQPFS
jgi:beta-glucosidase